MLKGSFNTLEGKFGPRLGKRDPFEEDGLSRLTKFVSQPVSLITKKRPHHYRPGVCVELLVFEENQGKRREQHQLHHRHPGPSPCSTKKLPDHYRPRALFLGQIFLAILAISNANLNRLNLFPP